jgi:hypothetical protein
MIVSEAVASRHSVRASLAAIVVPGYVVKAWLIHL